MKGGFMWCSFDTKYKIISKLFQTAESDDLDLEVSDIEAPDFDLEADFDVPDVDFNVSDV